MKKLILANLFVIIFIIQALAQAPESFKYQAVIRNSAGEAIINQDIGFRMSIIETSETGNAIYSETFTKTTNSFGLVSINIGEGSDNIGNFDIIDWGNDSFYLKVEIDESGGTSYTVLGVSKLGSVPYSLYAKNVENANDADADPLNEIQVLNFSNDTLYLSNGGQVYMGGYGNLWATHGNDIYNTNSKNVGVGLEDPMGKFVIQGDTAVSDTLPLFEVKNKDGITVFAVYDGGVRVYVNDDPAMANNNKSGFAIGGYRLDKSLTNEYMRVTPDSVRIYIKEESTNKANNNKGGFAIGGYRLDKTTPDNYMNIYAADTAYTIDTSEARMVWYPLKEAFLTGRVLIESADSVGQNSWATGFESKSIGNYSQALGYRARAKGNNATAIGYYANADSANSYALGNYAVAQDSGSYAIGTGAMATGLRSFAVGSSGIDSAGVVTSPTKAIGDYSYAFGMGSIASNIGAFTFGTQDTASGKYSLALGYKSKSTGYGSIAIGRYNNSNYTKSVCIGDNNLSSGNGSFAMGSQNTSLGWCTFAFGKETIAKNDFATAMGYKTYAYSFSSTATGRETTAYGTSSFAMGYRTIAREYASVAIGQFNDTLTSVNSPFQWYSYSEVFTIGNGTDDANRHNAMVVKNDGRIFFPDVYNDDIAAIGNRDLYINNNGQIGYISSSRRYKRNIVDMEKMDWFYKLRPVNYIYKKDSTNRKQYGLIAEEVDEINKYFVSYNNDGSIETVNYSYFISPMIKVIQEQKIEIEKLKTENFVNQNASKDNKSEIDLLKAEIEQLKNILEVKANK